MTEITDTRTREVIDSVSVGELVRRQLGREPDPWELALVQRDLVWQEDRMTALLDSLLARYPIGSLLLCQVASSATDARPQGTLQGHEYRVAAMIPQIVDGQQRSHALFSLFTGKGHGRFYVDLRAAWTRDAKYIKWLSDAEPHVDGLEADELTSPPDRHQHIDLAKFACQEDGETLLADALGHTLDDEDLDDALAQINPDFVVPHSPEDRRDILDKLNRLLSAWHEARIPVVTAVVNSPEDILELFTRANRGGEQVSQNDLYFAAVKTFWHDPAVPGLETISAKSALDQIVKASAGYLNVWGALSLTSRLALAGLGEGDIVPLRVDRLSRSNKDFIIRAIRKTAPIVAERITPFTTLLRANSDLKQGLRFAHPHLWEEVFAWVVVSNRTESGWSMQDVRAVETYILGATLFGYAQRLRDTYRRDAMRVCLDAAANGQPFPVHRLLSVARFRGEDLRRGRVEVPRSDNLQGLAKNNPAFIVAAAQGLSDEVKGLDWDHIIPDSWRSKLRLPRGSGRRFREETTHINDPGNFWQIDLSANRELKATAPKEKFERLVVADPIGRGRVSPLQHSGITEEHLTRFIDVGKDLDSGSDQESAAVLLAALIQDRNAWLIERLYQLPIGPTARLFGADHPTEPVGPPNLPDDLAARLELMSIRTDLEAATQAARKGRPASSNDLEDILDLGGAWSGLATRLDSVLRDVTRKHAKLSGAGVSRRISKSADAQTIKRSFPLRPVHAGDSFVLIASGQRTAAGTTPFWIRTSEESPNAETMWDQLRNSGEFTVSEFQGLTAIAIQVDPEMTSDEMRQFVDSEVTRLRSVIETDEDLAAE